MKTKKKKGEIRFTDEADSYINNKGRQKFWNYFLDITKKKHFNDVIEELREKYKVPPGFYKRIDGMAEIPPVGSTLEKDPEGVKKLRADIIEKICNKYRLHYLDFSDVIIHYIYYNELQPMWEFGFYGLCLIQDIVEEKEDEEGPLGDLVEKSDDIAYPIAIRISPYASQRDVIDFVKNRLNWEIISKELQPKYKDEKVKIGKIRAKNPTIQKRNDLIYKNRDKSLKSISELLQDRGFFLDEGHIAKIVSLEKEKRK